MSVFICISAGWCAAGPLLVPRCSCCCKTSRFRGVELWGEVSLIRMDDFGLCVGFEKKGEI